MNCLFCKIIKKQIDCKKIYEDESFLVFLDIDQSTPGHTLIIPKKHITDYTELDAKTLDDMFKLAHKISAMLMEKLAKSGITLLFNYGASQEIKHVHLHLLPDFSKQQEQKDIEEIYKIITQK